MLSEKAKGKQRAIDPEPATGPTREFVVRFTEGTSDLHVTVNEQDTLKTVKEQVRRERPHLQNKRLRFIHSGGLLADTTVVFSWLAALDGKSKHAEEDTSSSLPKTWIHCSVGREIEPGEEEDGAEQKAQLRPARGFDRLASVGFSESDIANFRLQFHSQSAANYLDTDFETEEEYDEHARALEEEWIDSLDSAGTATLSQNSSASNPSFLQGILIGFFFPILPLFFFRNSHPPAFWEDGSQQEPQGTVVFSKFMQMGLVVGFVINLFFGAWRFLLAS
ncbi:Ubiquitin-like domain-containing protein [Mycena indigotica]|uniref:Ubiquitin-like domain-containing protein n=1 Tax=Mycena indigotica TaxID=2126181 RepID=A0A8H6WEW2_9AGAR|nr:Ubiquitin-like domain-containing protein [Mycena indigotica]KAF7315227.1 Ubiquitin-like domain-containing protein [Mycena indigotica]